MSTKRIYVPLYFDAMGSCSSRYRPDRPDLDPKACQSALYCSNVSAGYLTLSHYPIINLVHEAGFTRRFRTCQNRNSPVTRPALINKLPSETIFIIFAIARRMVEAAPYDYSQSGPATRLDHMRWALSLSTVCKTWIKPGLMAGFSRYAARFYRVSKI